MHLHDIIIDTQGKVWELLDVEIRSKAEFEEMVGQANFSDAAVHFILFEPYSIEQDEILYYAAGTSPEKIYSAGH